MPTDKEIIMKANELRIGNYVTFNNFIQPEKIVIVDGRFLLPFNKTDSEINNYYQPIPLTEEWLFKLGFKKGYYNGGINFKLYDFKITKGNNWEFFNYSTIDRDQDGINQSDINIESVHQLQNLYFALTNTELVCQ